MNSPEMHVQAEGAAREKSKVCELVGCGKTFTPRRTWARFCSSSCRNAFHGAEARKEAQRAAAPELYEALLLLHDNLAEYQRINKLGGYDNHDMRMARAALAKAGYREPKAG